MHSCLQDFNFPLKMGLNPHCSPNPFFVVQEKQQKPTDKWKERKCSLAIVLSGQVCSGVKFCLKHVPKATSFAIF